MMKIVAPKPISAAPATVPSSAHKGHVHCPICTHTVPADVIAAGRKTIAVPGQRCPRCHSSLDAAFVLQVLQAA